MPTYLTTPIVDAMRTPVPHYGVTVFGYSKLSGAPTAHMIKLQGEKRWRRVMVWCFSNASTAFIRIKGEPHIVRDIPVRP